MRKPGQHFVDRVFEQGLEGASLPVSNRVWANISTELEKDQLRRKVLWYRGVAAASILLLMGLGAWMLVRQTNGDDLARFAKAQQVKQQVNLPSFAEIQRRKAVASWALPHGGNSASSDVGSMAVQKVRAAAETSSMGQQNGTIASKGQFTPSNEAQMAVVKNALEQAREGNARIRTLLQARTPVVLPVAATSPKRALPVLPVTDKQGELFASNTPRKKEKEFTYTLEEEEDNAAEFKRWEVGAGFSPEMHFSSTTPVNQGLSARVLADDPTEANADQLTPVVAYAAVLKAAYEIDDRWSVRSGLTYINRQTSASAGPHTSGKNAVYQNNLNLYSFELPVAVKYNVIHEDDFDYYVTAGASGNFFLHYDNYLQTSDGFIAGRRSSDGAHVLKPSQASVVASTGLRYRLLNRLSLNLEPGLRYGLIKNGFAFSQTKPLSTTLLSGLSFHF